MDLEDGTERERGLMEGKGFHKCREAGLHARGCQGLDKVNEPGTLVCDCVLEESDSLPGSSQKAEGATEDLLAKSCNAHLPRPSEPASLYRHCLPASCLKNAPVFSPLP